MEIDRESVMKSFSLIMKQNSFGCIEVPLMLYKGVLSRSFCCMLVKTVQIFHKEPLKIAVRAPGGNMK